MPQTVGSRLTLGALALVNAMTGLTAYAQAPSAQANPDQSIENHFKLPEGRKTGSTAGI